MLNEVTTGHYSSFEPDSEIGLFYNDTCINRRFVYDGKIWSGGEVALADEMKDIICYYPYSSVIQKQTERFLLTLAPRQITWPVPHRLEPKSLKWRSR